MFFVFLIDTLSTKTKTKTHNTCYLLLRACFFCSTHASLSMVNTIHRVYIECPSYKIALSVVYVCMYVWYCIHTMSICMDGRYIHTTKVSYWYWYVTISCQHRYGNQQRQTTSPTNSTQPNTQLKLTTSCCATSIAMC